MTDDEAGGDWRRLVWPSLVAMGGVLAVLVRGKPSIYGDAGVFLTMFDAVSEGERMYVDAFDHKDPLFYLLGSVQYRLAGVRGLFFADAGWVAAFGLAVYGLGRWRGVNRPAAAVVGVLAIALLTHGRIYAAGFTTVPAVAMLAIAALLTVRRQMALAGAAAAAVLLLKLSFAPMLLPVIVLAVGSRNRQAILRFSGGAFVPIGMVVLRMTVKGELGGYFDMVGFNIDYAQRVSPAAQTKDGIWFNLLRLRSFLGDDARLWLAVIVVLAAAGALLRIPALSSGYPTRWIEWFVVAEILGTAMLLGATYLWFHHLGVLAWPVALVGIEAAARWQRLDKRAGYAVAVVAAMAMVLIGDLGRSDVRELRTISARWDEPTPVVVPRAEAVMLESQQEGPIRLAISSKHFESVMPFFDERIELACPDFYQLQWFVDRMDDHLVCIGERATHVLRMVEATIPGYNPELDALLEEQFDEPISFTISQGREIRIYERTSG